MPLSRRRLLAGAALGASTNLAGCLGDEGDGATPTDDGMAATVRVREHPDLGEILVDAAGMTLYMFESDEPDTGSSACTGGCADAWPPLTVDGEPTAGSGVAASLSTFERADGATQVAAGGWPLYGYGADDEPGDATGQGSNDVWWVLAPDGSPLRGGAGDPTATPTDGGGGDPY